MFKIKIIISISILSLLIIFTSIIKNANEQNKTIRIKVIDNFYPLIGNVKVEASN